VDRTLRRAVNLSPDKRYEALSEFVHDLRHPNAKYLSDASVPLIERNPLIFWKGLSLVLGLIVIALLAYRKQAGF
jgi:hypothetical protein